MMAIEDVHESSSPTGVAADHRASSASSPRTEPETPSTHDDESLDEMVAAYRASTSLPKAKAKAKAKGKAKAKAKAKPKAKSRASSGRLVLGCPKCRGNPSGCWQCKNPNYSGSRGPR